ncbi:PREDICTED: neuropeptide Y receptor-like [Acropora digitifera]|uniref:neuropeptide Y receptor-like n=1 Tax=Acropora digitifera TaxID=70779 RepID=UPI00077A8EF8|nr:PREDICTED: neuropeptide Y receptor-like [Acropora digitifera]
MALRRSANMNATINPSFSLFQFRNASRKEPSCSVTFNLAEHKIGVTIALCIFFVFSLLGNSLIGVVVYKTPTLRKPINFLIVNMAMSDLLFSLIVVPVTLVYLHLHSWAITKGALASTRCKVTPYIVGVSILVSTQSLVVIAVDRFVAVVFPLRVSLLTSKRCPLCIASIWIVSMLLAIPPLLTNIPVQFDGKFSCVTNWKKIEGLGNGMPIADFYLAFATLFVYFPSALLIILYATIFKKLKSQKIPGEESTYSERQRTERNRNVLRMAVAIVFTFILCQLPGTTTVLVFLQKGNSLNCEFLVYLQMLLYVAYSAVNPCICLAFSGNYRQGLKKAFKYFS